MGTKAEELAKMARGEGCLGRAADDEPIFVLRGNDLTAPVVVRLWAWLCRLHSPHSAKTSGAVATAFAMEEWQAKHPDRAKYPD